MKKTISLCFTSVFLGSLLLFFLCSVDKKAERDLFAAIKEGNKMLFVARAEKNAKKLPCPLSFYKGCFLQRQGKFSESNQFFQNALQEAKAKETVALDVSLACLANAFLSEDRKEQELLLKKTESERGSLPLLSFFKGLFHYQNEEFEKALDAWKFFNEHETSKAGKWSRYCLDLYFPETERAICYAHSLLEAGSLALGREILEKQIHSNNDPLLCQKITIYLGLSYLKEAAKIPLDKRESFYQLACFYWDKSGNAIEHMKNRKLICHHLQNEAILLTCETKTREYQKWGLHLIQALQNWKAQKELLLLSQTLVAYMTRENDFTLSRMIREEFLTTPFHHLVASSLLHSLTKKVHEGNTEEILAKWGMLEEIAKANKELLREILTFTSKEFFEALKEGKSLHEIKNYLCLWKQLSPKPHEVEQFAKEIFASAKVYWQKEGQETRAIQLMDLAFELHPNVHREIENTLSILYADAENNNMIRRLSILYDALKHFKMNREELAHPSKIANYLADAEYLYLARNYYAAQIHANWVLKLAPNNEEAICLYGLSSFHLGEYNRAKTYLSMVKSRDEYAEKALILSEASCFDSEESRLVQIDAGDTFNKDE